jgi:tetratricopeptide (TPR) repeat protein
LETLWAFLSDPDNQQTLAWLGGGLVVAGSGILAAIKFFFPRPSGSSTPPAPTISADRGGIAAGGNVTVTKSGMGGLEVALLVAIVAGALLLLVVWLVPQDTPAIREDTEAIREDTGSLLAGQDEILDYHRRQIALLEREKGIPHNALVAHLVRLGADPAIDQAEVPRFLERFAEEFVTLREQWQAQTGAEIDATREAALALLDEGDLDDARDLLREARQQLRAVRQERARDEATLLADEAAIERLDLRYREAAALLGEAADLTAFDPETSWRHRLVQANVLQDLGREFGDKATLLEAIATYEQALALAPRATRPDDWAATQNNLGNALQTLRTRESGTATLERAVAAYEAALLERTRKRVPLEWAMTQNNLGNTLATLGERESGTANLERAVEVYEVALEEYTRERMPLDWAMTQNNLGAALQILGERESGTATLERAVAAYEAAMLEYTRERMPLHWAATQNNLGNALEALGSRESGTVTLERAVEAFQAALEERTRDRVPLDWAMTQNNLGSALRTLGSRENGTATLDRAVEAFERALEAWTRERVPHYWALTEENLAIARLEIGRRRGDAGELRAALAAVDGALEEYRAGKAEYDIGRVERLRADILAAHEELGD